MPHQRLVVALMVPGRAGAEIDGLRRALGEVRRIGPHLTLVPPVNVRDDSRERALEVLRAAAARCAPLTLTLGPVRTFWPDNPVLYLAVGGDPGEVDALVRLRDALFTPPFSRPVTWPFVPHVTVAAGASPARIDQAVAALSDFSLTVRLDRVHVLAEQVETGARWWAPVADAELGPARIVGRGGLPVELTVSERVDPEAADRFPPRTTVTVVARREGGVVGVAEAVVVGDDLLLLRLAVEPGRERQGIGAHLARTLEAAARERSCRRLIAAVGADQAPLAGLLRAVGWRAEPAADLGVLRRDVPG